MKKDKKQDMSALIEKVDQHVHCWHSQDSGEMPTRTIREGIKKNVKYLAFTDHYDRDYLYGLKSDEYVIRQMDLEHHIKSIQRLQKKYIKKIYVAVGAEVGYSKEAEKDYIPLNDDDRIDVIINSIHTIYGYDCYYKSYFDTTTKEGAYNDYLDCVYDSLDAKYDYQIIGHIGYISRKAPYDDKVMRVEDYKEKLTKIFKKIIELDKTVEINTNIKTEEGFLPTFDMLKLYRELGGERITFSSDAHIRTRLVEKYDLAMEALKKLGFTKLDYFIKRKRYQIDI